mgnify:CR=1 FL=1
MNNLSWKFVKPLKDNKAVETFEADYGLKLPQDIIACIKQNNGGRPDKKVFDTTISKGRVIKSLLSFNKDDLDTVYDAMDILKGENSNLVPFASDPGGNYICFDTKQQDIVIWLHETNTTEKISGSFTAFLERLY